MPEVNTYNFKRFHYSGYWRTWSRVLGNVDHSVVEVNLTPIPCSSRTWENDVAPVIIRKHYTPAGDRDEFTGYLPPDVVEAMIENLGEDKTRSLLEANYMELIDWDKYREAGRGGGVSLDDCRKVPRCPFHPDREATDEGLCADCYDAMLDAKSGGW